MDEQAERKILEAVVARGWVAASDLAALEPAAGSPGVWGGRVDKLLAGGRLDRIALAALAEELGISPPLGDRSTTAMGSAPGRPMPLPAAALAGWDRFKLVERLGAGGAGEVYRAYDPRLRRDVAIKFLAADPGEQAERFRREAQAQARVDHAHVCKVYETGHIAGRFYIAMQYVAGGTLSALAPGLPTEEKVRLVHKVALAVHAAHRLGIVHRDLKPSNIMVERAEDGGLWPYVVDFGLARELAAGGASVSSVAGTPGYMAPEQARGEPADRRTDVYGLGATLYSVLAGRPPFEGGSAKTLMQVVSEDPPPLRTLHKNLPRDLGTIAAKCLDKEPGRRYDSAKALADDLARFLDGEPILARPAGWLTKLWVLARRHKLAFAAGGLGLAGVVVFGVLFLRSELRSQARSNLARRLGDEARATENIMRLAHLLPLHDVRGDEARVRRQMVRLEEEMRGLGDFAEGPGEYALGRGALALGRFDEARRHLEKAWAAGERGPDVAYALGQALGGAYRHALDEVAVIQSREARLRRRAQVESELRDPALRYLRLGQGSLADAPAFVEGTIALYEGRPADALAKAAEASDAAPWLYEARLLEGNTYSAMLVDAREKGDPEAAVASAGKARAAYQAAAEIARSDGAIYRAECALENDALVVEMERGKADAASFASAAVPCDRALAVNPDDASVYLKKATLARHEAEIIARKGNDPSAAVERALALTDEVLRRDPGSQAALVEKGIAHTVFAYAYQLRHGIDPRPRLALAIESFERAIALRADANTLMEAGGAYATLTTYQRDHGDEWQKAFAQAVDHYETAIRLDPKLVSAYNNLGTVYEERGDHELQHGKDPRPSMKLAIEQFDKAIELKPSFSYSYQNRAGAYSNFGEYDLVTGHDPSPWVAKAIEGYEKAIGIRPDYPYAYDNLARMHWLDARWLLEHGDPTAAVEKGLAILEAERKYVTDDIYNPRFVARLKLIAANAALRAGDRTTALERIAEARAASRAAVTLAAEAEALAIAAEVEWRAAQAAGGAAAEAALSDGIAFAGRAIADNPTLSDGYAVRAALEAARGLTAEAKADLARALEINPLLDHTYRDAVEK